MISGVLDTILGTRAIETRDKGLLVGLVNVVHGQDGQIPVVSQVAQSNAGAGLDADLIDCLLGEVESDGHTEEDTIGQAVFLDDAVKGAFPSVQVPQSASTFYMCNGNLKSWRTHYNRSRS